MSQPSATWPPAAPAGSEPSPPTGDAPVVAGAGPTGDPVPVQYAPAPGQPGYSVPGHYPAGPYAPAGYGPALPVPPRRPDRSRTALRVTLVLALVLALFCGIGDTVLAVVLRGQSATFVGGTAQSESAIKAMLERRAKAVLAHDEDAFLADIDRDRPMFLQHEKDEFANLQALEMATFTLEVSRVGRYPVADADPAVVASFDHGLTSVAVTVRYAVRGLDSEPVAAPWIPVVGERNGHWLIADDMVKGSNLPGGVGGLPWQTGPIVVKRTSHVVAVISVDDERIAPTLLNFADTGVRNALDFLPSGWPGKVLVVAVSDGDVIGSYFRDDMELLNNVAAVAVPAFDKVDEWTDATHYVTSRVLFNPDSLGGNEEQLQMTLTHEFIHVATGPFTTGYTPLWLVEGTAEYVAQATGHVPDADLRRQLQRFHYPTELPGDRNFYQVGYPNYLYSALACRYVVTKYGKAKLLALYSYFTSGRSQETALSTTLGVSEAEFTAGWISFLHSL